MKVLFFIQTILANVLLSLRILSLLRFRIAIIAFLYAAALIFYCCNIQSIGSGIGSFSVLFHETLIGLYLKGNLMHYEMHQVPLEELLIFSLFPIKRVESNRLTNLEKQQFSLSNEMTEMIVGLTLGDLHIRKPKLGVNPCLNFSQGLLHKDYLLHLYEKFQSYCPKEPKIYNAPPHKMTGISYSTIRFQTFSLPCFRELHALFYLSGKKIIPSNINDLLTPLSLAYWIADDGSFNKRSKRVILCTQSFSLDEVNLLVAVLNKWNLECRVNKDRNGYVIVIRSKSLPELQKLLKPHMPCMMNYKIGL